MYGYGLLSRKVKDGRARAIGRGNGQSLCVHSASSRVYVRLEALKLEDDGYSEFDKLGLTQRRNANTWHDIRVLT